MAKKGPAKGKRQVGVGGHVVTATEVISEAGLGQGKRLAGIGSVSLKQV